MKIHIMGIGGSIMSNFAALLKRRGHQITGSDENIYEPSKSLLKKYNIQTSEGYKRENLQHKPDYVIVGNVISSHFEEVQEMKRLDLKFLSFPEALKLWVIENRQCFVVAGTHGKTTTTSLLAWIAEENGLEPGFLVGGIPFNHSESFCFPQKNLFIIEGDEYDTSFFDKRPKFLHYKPQSVILTSIEFDHGDIYKDISEIKKSFKLLVEGIPKKGNLIYYQHDKNIKDILDKTDTSHLNCYSYGFDEADYCLKKRYIESSCEQTFSVSFLGESLLEKVSLKLIGKHNALNALSVIALSHQLSWSLEKTKQSLSSFKGIKRRQEILTKSKKVILMEDFAHHPTSVKAMIETVKEHFKDHKVVAVFEPCSNTSQSSFFQNDYVRALKEADRVLLPQHLSKEERKLPLSIPKLLEDLRVLGTKSFSFKTPSEALQLVKSFLDKDRQACVVLVMSNGNFQGLFSLFKKKLCL